MSSERWVEAAMNSADQAKCDLLGIRVMAYYGSKDKSHRPFSTAYSVRKRVPLLDAHQIINLCTMKADGTKEVAIFRSVESAIRGATSKANTFLR